ncbi:ribosomal protein S3AE [Caldisphaera lagunensis DSM 15908]|uniref:Small ribosomal subunit protein eS1 n=1 Tax=Caldisphaera lagunensis (strain DSM 15908 / JCM 11604 / ANMR 0165 / IC-154) TaxID=1056495 RepID=L0AB03_CALLD|nr:30S ribosomal protein S3ae [Caldisphaera lagunensis]AFZ70215.1 ribosomal protein S3AE [Caldisphaera lagunensis DSM 15908]
MPRQKSKTSVRDAWKLKKWYNIISPETFGKIQIGLTPADSEEKLSKRTVEITLFDITGNYSHVNTKLKFQINSVSEDNAYTIFKGHELLRDYLRSLTRRRSSKIAIILNVTTKDGAKIRVTSAVFTQYRCKTSQKQTIRKIMKDIIESKGNQLTFDEFVRLAVFGEQDGSLAQEITKAAKKVCNVRKVEIIKQKVIELPKNVASSHEAVAA